MNDELTVIGKRATTKWTPQARQSYRGPSLHMSRNSCLQRRALTCASEPDGGGARRLRDAITHDRQSRGQTVARDLYRKGCADFLRPAEFVRLGPAQQVVEFHPSLHRAGDGKPDDGEPQTVFGPRRVIAGEVKTIPISAANAVKRRATRAVNPDLFESQAAGERQSHYNVAMEILERLASGGAGAASAGPGRLVQREESFKSLHRLIGIGNHALIKPRQSPQPAQVSGEVTGARGASQQLFPGLIKLHLRADVTWFEPILEIGAAAEAPGQPRRAGRIAWQPVELHDVEFDAFRDVPEENIGAFLFVTRQRQHVQIIRTAELVAEKRDSANSRRRSFQPPLLFPQRQQSDQQTSFPRAEQARMFPAPQPFVPGRDPLPGKERRRVGRIEKRLPFR